MTVRENRRRNREDHADYRSKRQRLGDVRQRYRDAHADRALASARRHDDDSRTMERRRIHEQGEEGLKAQRRMDELAKLLQKVGLGGERGQVAFAEVMHEIMTEYINHTYAREWGSPSNCVEELEQWVVHQYARRAVETLYLLDGSNGVDKKKPLVPTPLPVTLEDVGRWKEMAIEMLGRLRVSELFDIVVEWPDSAGAIEDLKVKACRSRHLSS